MTIPVDSRSRFLLPLDEQASSILPSDATGNLADPTVPAGLTRPAVVSGTIGGYGRDFVRASTTGLLYDDAADDLKLTRGVAIAAILRFDLATLSTGNLCTLIQRGRGGGADPIAFGLRLEAANVSGGVALLRMFWQAAAGTDVLDVGVTFTWPASEYLFVAASREMVDGALAVRYQINGEPFVGGTAHGLDVGAAASADVSVGCGMSGASYVNHLDGVLDSLEVFGEALSAEELEWTWRRLSEDQPNGVLAMRRLVPPGVYSTEPSSRIQRELANEGRAIGHAKSIARRLRDYGLPSKAWGDRLERWEALAGSPARAGDSIAQRRTRVLDRTQNVRGFSLADVRTALAEPFDLAAADVDLLEYGNDTTETFTSGTPSQRAKVMPGNGSWLSDASAIAAGHQEHTSGADDLRYEGLSTEKAGLYLWTLAGRGRDAWVHGKVDLSVVPDDTVMGIAIGSFAPVDQWLFVGVAATAGILRIAYLHYKNGVLDEALTDITSPWAVDPTFFRVHHDSTSSSGPGTYRVRYGDSDANAAAASPVLVSGGPTAPDWAGFCVVARRAASSVTATCRFDDLFIHAPGGDQKLHWYAYRDPGDPGSPNMDAARREVARVKPAHTEASAIQTQNVLTDTATTLTDREPIGV